MKKILCLPFLILFIAGNLFSQESGTVKGVVIDSETKSGAPNVTVRLKGTSYGSATDVDGNYLISNIPAGKYILVVSSVGSKTIELLININPNESTIFTCTLKSDAVQVGEVTVLGVSLRPERITEAPAAVSVLEAEDIARYAAHGQLPKLLETQPGVDLVQSGLFDFNINTRGFNSSLNRRVLVLVDGRDLGTAFLGATEWSGLTAPLEELGRIEFVRGPGSALYGANAYNGVMNITSLTPKELLGNNVSVAIGEMGAKRFDFRHANILTDEISYKINIGSFEGLTSSKSRDSAKYFEYKLSDLNVELIQILTNKVTAQYGTLRFDYEPSDDSRLTLEGGNSINEGELIVTGIGRVQVQQASKPWGRLNYSMGNFNVMFYSNNRFNDKPEKSLSTGLDLFQDATVNHFEMQKSFTFGEDLFFVIGGSRRTIQIDTKGSLMNKKIDDQTIGTFSQIEWKVNNQFKVVAATRLDWGDVHPAQISPKIAVVYSHSKAHNFRATYNEAFQAPNYAEKYLNVKHPIKQLYYLGNMAEPDGIVSLKDQTGPIPYPQKPNIELPVEKIKGFEIGYSGIYDNQLFITFDSYYNVMSDFVTDLAPGVNPRFVVDGVAEAYFTDKRRTIWSYGSAGEVNEWGFEAGLNYFPSKELKLEANYSSFNFEILEKAKGDFLLPNTPKWRANFGVSYIFSKDVDAGLRVKHVPGYEWAAGIYNGEIKTYTLVDLAASYNFADNTKFGINVANLFNKKHYQILGGSVLQRRALATLSYNF